MRVAVTLVAATSFCCADAPKALRVFSAEPTIQTTEVPGWAPDQTPADFLDGIGGRVKVRWRQLYRPSTPPQPSTVRPLSAFTLGSLVADSYLALAAQDSQRFRDNNQDVLGYCRVLGLNEKLTPRLMSQGKLAENEKWADLRQEVTDGHQELCRVLREQRDEDLAILVELGAWCRLLEMVCTAVNDAAEPATWPLAIGSPALLKDMKSRYSQLSDVTRGNERLVLLGEGLEFLCRNWDNDEVPGPERVTKTRNKLEILMRKLTLK